MELLVGLGAVISVIGLIGIVWSVVLVRRAKTAARDDADLRARVQKALPLNLGAFFLSVIGLMCVAVGVFLG